MRYFLEQWYDGNDQRLRILTIPEDDKVYLIGIYLRETHNETTHSTNTIVEFDGLHSGGLPYVIFDQGDGAGPLPIQPTQIERVDLKP